MDGADGYAEILHQIAHVQLQPQLHSSCAQPTGQHLSLTQCWLGAPTATTHNCHIQHKTLIQLLCHSVQLRSSHIWHTCACDQGLPALSLEPTRQALLQLLMWISTTSPQKVTPLADLNSAEIANQLGCIQGITREYMTWKATPAKIQGSEPRPKHNRSLCLSCSTSFLALAPFLLQCPH
jgi:hypothetical protein